MDHFDRKPRCTSGLRKLRASTALYGFYVCQLAVYSRLRPGFFGEIGCAPILRWCTGHWGFWRNPKQFSAPYPFSHRTGFPVRPSASNANRWALAQKVPGDKYNNIGLIAKLDSPAALSQFKVKKCICKAVLCKYIITIKTETHQNLQQTNTQKLLCQKFSLTSNSVLLII
jgi:hypothetical protein